MSNIDVLSMVFKNAYDARVAILNSLIGKRIEVVASENDPKPYWLGRKRRIIDIKSYDYRVREEDVSIDDHIFVIFDDHEVPVEISFHKLKTV